MRHLRIWVIVLASSLGIGVLLLSPPRGTAQSGGPDRTAGCSECQEMLGRLPLDEQHDPAHDFDCASCHHPHGERTRAEWRGACYTCHPQAWTQAVAHRLDANVFVECMNCHQPHGVGVDAEDCRSCHGDLAGEAGDVLAMDVQGAERFPHSRHDALECQKCHDNSTRHATLTMTDQATCMSCHHGAEAGVDCATCHSGSERPARKTVQTRMTLAGTALARRLPFDHQRHGDVPCATCHASSGAVSAGAQCASCHEDHHRPEAECVTCHNTPKPTAHSLEVHAARTCEGSGCHGSRGVTTLNLQQRNVCLSCHQDQQAHYPDDTCASCHKLTPEPLGPGR